MKRLLVLVTLLLGLFSGLVSAMDAVEAEPVTSLRGEKSIDDLANQPEFKRWQADRDPIERDYIQQPPLIPHKIDGYQINPKFNKCLTCHSWSNYKAANATKISLTHFEDRDENVLANVAARRYFCTQCHVPQVDAEVLIENTFEPVQVLK